MTKINLHFINQHGVTVYSADTTGRFAGKAPDGEISIILEDVTEVFDGVYSRDGAQHFAIQTADGGLVYLRYDGSEWKKYGIFQSKSRLAAIRAIRLVCGKNQLCAFYVMEHEGRNLLVKHCFSAASPHISPEVIDCTDARRDFALCERFNGVLLFYRDANGERQEKCFDMSFNEVPHQRQSSEAEIFALRAVNTEKGILTAYTALRKSYTALVFGSYPPNENTKIITFGIGKGCVPHICASGQSIIIEWQEDDRIMQSVSSDSGTTFSKPSPLPSGSAFVRARTAGGGCSRYIDECAAYRGVLSAESIAKKHTMPSNEKERMNTMNLHDTYRDFESTAFFTQKLNDIENDVAKLGKQLEEMCMFLDKLTEFKKEER